MQYGHFDDAAREYVITEPQTPSPWINYLGSEAFFTLMSNTSGGYSFYKDARMLRLTRYRYNNVPTDAGGQYFYINDGGVVWTPGFMPVKTPLDRYECRHGLGYTRITGEKNGLGAVETAMVPRGVNALVTKVELTNRLRRGEGGFDCSASSSSACGTRRTTRPTSSATSPPARSRSKAARSITRRNTASAATTLPCTP